MRGRNGRLALGAVAAALMSAGGCAHAPAAPLQSSPSHLLGQDAPAFRRPTLVGATFDTAEASGRLLVVDFFADYCRPCQRTLPALEALHREHPDIIIVGVSVDEDQAHAAKSVLRHHLTFAVVHDAGNVLAGRFRVTELPNAFVIDGAGKVRFVAGPGQPEDAVARTVSSLGGGS